MSAHPVRVQMSRRKGFNLQAASPNGLPVIYAGRPGILGNPFPVDVYGQALAVEMHRKWLDGQLSSRETMGVSRCDRWSDPPGVSLGHVRAWVLDRLKEVRGKNLACWCHLLQPCHVDNLLRIANQ